MSDAEPRGYFQSPVELDAAARALDRALLQTPSPQKQFLLVAEFWSQARKLPQAWTSSYLMPLTPMFVELLRLPALSNIPPGVWRETLDFIREIERRGWGPTGAAMESIQLFAMEHTIRAHAYVSSLRELHQLLLDMHWLEHPLPIDDWTAVFASSTTAFGLFRAYVSVLEARGGAQMPVFTRILDSWREFRERSHAVSVVLLEADGDGRHAAGRVQLMDILPQEGVVGDGNLNNLLGAQGYETIEQLGRAQTLAETLITSRFRKTPPRRRYHFSLHETSAALVGGSLGCAAAAGIATGITQRLNLAQRWTLSTTISCIGGLASDGALEAGSWETIEKKILIAFHSPLERIVIHALHRESALLALQRLQRAHPNRQLDVIGITRFDDLAGHGGVLEIVQRRRAERTREYVARHGVAFLLLLVLLLVLGSGFFAYRAYYDYPNLEHTMGLQVGPGSIVFNPKDSLAWCFRDERTVLDNRVGFGDIEVGDGFTRTFTLWNMTPSELTVLQVIEGADSADFFVNSSASTVTLSSGQHTQITVMFAPRQAGTEKRAALVLRNPRSGKEFFRLRLEGAAGPPLPAGYALRLDGIDDQLHFGKRSTAFDLTASQSKEATFECWIRPSRPLANAMILHNGQSQGHQQDIEDLFFGFASPDTLYYRVGSAIGMLVLRGRQVAVVGRWMHLALAISIPQRRIAVYVNGEEISDIKQEFLFDGPGTPFVTVGARNNGTITDLHFAGDIDELRLWHRFRSASQIAATMQRRLPGLTPDLAGYWDMDGSVENTVFNANKLAHSGTLPGRPTFIRSDLRREGLSADYDLVSGPGARTALQLRAGRYLVAARPPLPAEGDATFAFWFEQTDRPAIHFNYVLKARGWISVENNMLFTMRKKELIAVTPGWHLGVCTVTGSGELRFYLDGQRIAETRTVESGTQDWRARFEGMMLGFRFDKEQQLASRYYDWYHPTLSHSRSYAALHVWSRLLRDEEIQEMYARDVVPASRLAASWRLDRPSDANGNFTDIVSGRLLHIKRIRSWE